MAHPFPQQARRGRKALCWAFAVFILAQLAGGLLLDYCWPELRFPTANLTFQALSKQPRSPDIICLGSSRFGAGFNQEEVRDRLRDETGEQDLTVFNAAIEAGDLVTADFILAHALDQGVCPRMVVIEVSPETVARRSEWMGQHVLRQLNWEDVPGHLGDIWRSGNTVRLLSARLLPLHMHRRQICLAVHEGVVERLRASEKPAKTKKKNRGVTAPSSQGVPWEIFMELDQQCANPLKTSAGLPAIQRWLKNYGVGGGSGRALGQLVKRCQERGIMVILIAAPVTEAHRSLYDPGIDYAFLCRMVDVSRRYGCRFVDYRARIPDTYFLDNHHLHRSGGTHFSRLLTQEVLTPAWMEQQETSTSQVQTP